VGQQLSLFVVEILSETDKTALMNLMSILASNMPSIVYAPIALFLSDGARVG